MGRLTEDKEQEIIQVFQELKSYTKTARETSVDRRTVKSVLSRRKPQGVLKATNSIDSNDVHEGWRRTIYSELAEKVKPIDIAIKHDIPLELIEKEAKVFSRMEGNPLLRELSSKIFGYMKVERFKDEQLEEYLKIFRKKKFLTVEEIMELLYYYGIAVGNINTQQQALGLLLPSSWQAIGCQRCNTLLAGASKYDQTGLEILQSMRDKIIHTNCGGGRLIDHDFRREMDEVAGSRNSSL